MSKVPYISCPNLSKNSLVKHGFFTRNGGASDGIYSSLNCGVGSKDLSATVKENRNRALKTLTNNAKLFGLYQIHSNKIIYVDEKSQDRAEADALVTDKKNIALSILTADCTPVFFCDSKNNIIAAAHAGWNGAISGIIENTVQKMLELGAELPSIQASIGPTIAQASYEVGEEFYQTFCDKNSSWSKLFIPSKNHSHHMFDLPAFVEMQLKNAGVRQISNVKRDTYAEAEEFFSYRRSCHQKEADYGRNISIITLD